MSELRQSSGDDLLQFTVCAVLALMAAASLASPYLDDLRAVALVAAAIHLKPFGLLAVHFDWLHDAPYFGKALFLPASSASSAFGLPLTLAEAASSSGFRKSVMVGSGTAAAVLYGPCFIWMAASSRRFRPDLAHRTVHDLESLIESQCAQWPQANYASRFLNLKRDSGRDAEVDAGADREFRSVGQLVWREPPPLAPPHSHCSMRPEDWLRAQGFVTREGPSHGPLSDKDFEFLSADSLCEAFEKQLGNPWKGFAALSPCKRALAAAFAYFHNYESDQGRSLLDRLAMLAAGKAAGQHGMDEAVSRDRRMPAEIDAILNSDSALGLSRAANRHAWETTALVAMLQAARKDRGVLASASFLWLKREDRGLWYALNNAGNAAIMVEAAGALAHFRAELQIGRPLRRPATHQAAHALLENYFDIAPGRIAKRKSLARFRTPVGTRLEQLASRR